MGGRDGITLGPRGLSRPQHMPRRFPTWHVRVSACTSSTIGRRRARTGCGGNKHENNLVYQTLLSNFWLRISAYILAPKPCRPDASVQNGVAYPMPFWLKPLSDTQGAQKCFQRRSRRRALSSRCLSRKADPRGIKTEKRGP